MYTSEPQMNQHQCPTDSASNTATPGCVSFNEIYQILHRLASRQLQMFDDLRGNVNK